MVVKSFAFLGYIYGLGSVGQFGQLVIMKCYVVMFYM